MARVPTDVTSPVLPADVNDAYDQIDAITAILGAAPAGANDDLTLRLADMEIAIAAAGGGGAAALITEYRGAAADINVTATHWAKLYEFPIQEWAVRDRTLLVSFVGLMSALGSLHLAFVKSAAATILNADLPTVDGNRYAYWGGTSANQFDIDFKLPVTDGLAGIYSLYIAHRGLANNALSLTVKGTGGYPLPRFLLREF